jgi:aldose sugar dehydrogenase
MHRHLGSKRGKLLIFIGSGLTILSAIVVAVAFRNIGNDHSSSVITNDNSNNSVTSKEQTELQFEPLCAQLQQQSNSSSTLPLPKVKDNTLKVDLVTDGLSNPTSMAFVDRCTILALQKNDGKVIIITTNSNGTIQKEPILQIQVENASERGLLGIAVANDTTAAGMRVFLYFTENDHGDVRNRVYSYNRSGNKSLTDRKLILDLPGTPGPNYDGGKMVIGPDGMLYAVIGDLNRNGALQNFKDGPSPDDTSVIFRVNLEDGSAAKGDPFLSSSSVSNDKTEEILGRYFAYGIRNSFGMDFDPVTGKLWITENGPDSYDEINIVEPGFNSGWHKVIGPISRTNVTAGELISFNGSSYRDPVFSWYVSVGPTDIEFLKSSKLGEKYENNVFVGDINHGNLYFFEVNGDRTGLTFRDPRLLDLVADPVKEDHDSELSSLIFGEGFGGITDLETGPDEYLYMLTYLDGKIYRITKGES